MLTYLLGLVSRRFRAWSFRRTGRYRWGMLRLLDDVYHELRP